ncbi:cilia- and flagella-associated protein 45 isoform X1 [Oncorhynchus kisutch]|uniref:cilia- and flagella-associated protein 45 isoform X1 n=1 Tax=Oncorhynchus kisutch TaxID=8019 RepID=UPI0012DC02EF|nr:cilia- and flagella-associated protein 45 isoform X1 [Oncorhynchus kisutch]
MSSPSRKTQKPDTVRIITRDLIRDLKIPSKDPSGLSVFLHPTEIERITTASRVSTKEELEATLDAQRREREAAMDAAEDRKAHICQADLSCQKNQDLSDLEAEAKERAQYLLERANAMRMEQEDEVKKLNELILDAHCHAVRDAQILERQQILAELQDEERRLDAMMEVDHRRALEALEQIDELRKHQRIQGNQLIINQIEERLEDRMLQNEMKGHEGQQMLERMQMEELEALVRKKEEQQRLQEILRINEDRLLAKERKKEDYEHLHNRRPALSLAVVISIPAQGQRGRPAGRGGPALPHRRDQGEAAQGAQGCWTTREVLQ